MLKKLRLKFVLINMVIVAAMLAAIFATVYYFTDTDLDRQCQMMLQNLTQSGQRELSNVSLPYFTIQLNIHGDVRVVGHTYFDLTDERFLQELIQQVFSRQDMEGYIEAYALRYRVCPVQGGHLMAFVDVSSHGAALTSLVQSFAVIGLVSLGACLVISVFLARWAVKPVEKAWQQQRQFVSDASHELKTPLTVIMSNAELLQNSQSQAEDRARFADSILIMARQMGDLAEGLLELARADNGQIRKAFAQLDYSKLVSDALLPFEPVLFENELTLQSQIQPDIHINGSGQYLRQVVEILLDNAAKYATPGIVQVRLQQIGRGQCLLTVSNPGPAIPKEALEKIFNRFYRGDQARSRTGSFGLGLSIARSIVQEHHGRIWAESNHTGNCFFVQLPCE